MQATDAETIIYNSTKVQHLCTDDEKGKLFQTVQRIGIIKCDWPEILAQQPGKGKIT